MSRQCSRQWTCWAEAFVGVDGLLAAGTQVHKPWLFPRTFDDSHRSHTFSRAWIVGRLTKEEFVVGLWLIDGRLKGKKLPVKVSDSVWRWNGLLSGGQRSSLILAVRYNFCPKVQEIPLAKVPCQVF